MFKSMNLLTMMAVVLAAALSIGHCDEKCEKNMEYKTCVSICPKTCEDVANMGGVKVCPAICGGGCVCKEGYVRNSGQCVPESTCPCAANAHYSKCASTCPLTCENYKDAVACKTQCVPGCTCNEGYVRSGESGKCVLPKDCPLAA